MGFHNLLAGQDLHEPSRVRVANNTTLPLGIGQLVKIGGPVVAAVTSITQLADPDDTLVAYIDTFIPVGGESTAVLFGRVLNVPVLDPANNTLAEGELLKVGENSVFEYTDSIGDRVGVVLRRITDGEVMDVLFSPFAAANPVHAQLISTNAPNSPYINEVIPVPMGSAVNVSQDTVITYSDDVVRFAHIDNNDSLQYDQPTGTVSRGGTFELSVPNRIDFNEDLEVLMDLTPFSGSNTINIDLVVIRNSVLSGDEVLYLVDLLHQLSTHVLD